MIKLTTPADGDRNQLDRIPLFELDDKAYTMPGEIQPYVSIRYLWMIREEGADQAAAWLMEYVLGAEGFEALASYEDLQKSDFQAIMDAIRDHVMANVDGDEGKGGRSKKGRRK